MAAMEANNSSHSPSDPPERLHRPSRVCARLDMSRSHLDALIADGHLDVVRIGTRGRRITESSIQRFIADRRDP